MNCSVCAKELTAAETLFCYWCGQQVCEACVRYILLPLDTKAAVCPDCETKPTRDEAGDESMMELMVNAALSGHNLTEWVLVEDGSGWQARCRLCQEIAWVGTSGVQYSLLSDRCQGQA